MGDKLNGTIKNWCYYTILLLLYSYWIGSSWRWTGNIMKNNQKDGVFQIESNQKRTFCNNSNTQFLVRKGQQQKQNICAKFRFSDLNASLQLHTQFVYHNVKEKKNKYLLNMWIQYAHSTTLTHTRTNNHRDITN